MIFSILIICLQIKCWYCIEKFHFDHPWDLIQWYRLLSQKQGYFDIQVVFGYGPELLKNTNNSCSTNYECCSQLCFGLIILTTISNEVYWRQIIVWLKMWSASLENSEIEIFIVVSCVTKLWVVMGGQTTSGMLVCNHSQGSMWMHCAVISNKWSWHSGKLV